MKKENIVVDTNNSIIVVSNRGEVTYYSSLKSMTQSALACANFIVCAKNAEHAEYVIIKDHDRESNVGKTMSLQTVLDRITNYYVPWPYRHSLDNPLLGWQ